LGGEGGKKSPINLAITFLDGEIPIILDGLNEIYSVVKFVDLFSELL
jgi:hypothetical protein